SIVHAADDDLLMPVAAKALAAPSQWARVLAGILAALPAAATQAGGALALPEAIAAELAGVQPTDAERAIAASLVGGERKALLLGNAVAHHPAQAQLARLAQAIADATGARLGWLGEAANAVGGWLAGAV